MPNKIPTNWNIVLRPKNLGDVYGNDSIKRYLTNKSKKGDWDKAYLFNGMPGNSKTTFAKIIAKYLSCKRPNQDGSPCDDCPDCRAINDETWTRDAVLLDGNDKDRMSASEARAYVEKFCSFPATRGKNKVMIVDEAGKLSKEAISAFLKPLESPKDGFYFIFTTMENLGKDVSSMAMQRRCKSFRVSTPKPDEIYLYLASIAKKLELTKDESIPKSFWTEGLELISKSCNFSYGKAISMFEQCIGGWIFDKKEMMQVLAVIDEENLNAALDDLCHGKITETVRSTFLDGDDLEQVFQFAHYRLVQAKAIRAFGKRGDGDWREAVAEKLASTPMFEIVCQCFDAFSDAGVYFKKNRFISMVADLAEELKRSTSTDKPVSRRTIK